MRALHCFALPAVLLAALAVGCGEGSQEAGSAKTKGDQEHAHPTAGPHGGHLIELGNEEYHAELLHNDAEHKVTIYFLDSTALQLEPIEQETLTLNLTADGNPQQFTLNAVNATDGKASQFEVVSEEAIAALQAEKTTGRLNVTINDKQYVGNLEHTGHGEHDHESHDHKHEHK